MKMCRVHRGVEELKDFAGTAIRISANAKKVFVMHRAGYSLRNAVEILSFLR